jgi:hypothetical protein
MAKIGKEIGIETSAKGGGASIIMYYLVQQ